MDGAGLGTWIGGLVGTAIPIPFVGTTIGAFVGGVGGDILGGAIYDMILMQSEVLLSKGLKQRVNQLIRKNILVEEVWHSSLILFRYSVNQPKASAVPSQQPSGDIPSSISSGTGGTYEREPSGTKLAGDLGRYIYKTLQPQTDEYGDFSYPSEHPILVDHLKDHITLGNVNRQLILVDFGSDRRKLCKD